jgi:hypothetical protein
MKANTVNSRVINKSLVFCASLVLVVAFQNCTGDLSSEARSASAKNTPAINSPTTDATSNGASPAGGSSSAGSTTPTAQNPGQGNAPAQIPIPNSKVPSPNANQPAQAKYEFSKDFRLLYLSLRNIEPSTASNSSQLQVLDTQFRANPSASTLLGIRYTLVDFDNSVIAGINETCNNIGMESTSCIAQYRAGLKGGVNTFDMANRLYIHQLAVSGACGAVNEPIGQEFVIDFGISPACDQWVSISNIYANYTPEQIHGDFVKTSFLPDQISKYLAAVGGSQSEVASWQALVAQRSLSLQDVRINIQVYK